MSFQKLVQSAQIHFPKLIIKYKDESLLMKILGKIMFFNKAFMTDFTTTLGNTVYFPTKGYTDSHPVSASAVLMHELVHISDYNKYGAILFTLGYASPQIFSLLVLPALFLLSWKLALLPLLFLLPIPSFFRAYFEKRAYMVSLYIIKRLDDKVDLSKSAQFYISCFKNSAYYFMWPFSLNSEFDAAVSKIEAGSHPYQDDIFNVLDQIINAS